MGWACCRRCQCVIHLTALVLCVVYGVRVRLLLPENAYRTEGRRKRLESHLVLVLVILNEQERNKEITKKVSVL